MKLPLDPIQTGIYTPTSPSIKIYQRPGIC